MRPSIHAQREQEARPMQTRRSGHPPTHDRPSASASKSHLNRSRSHPRIPIDLWMAKTSRPATNFAHTHAIDPLPAERQAAALSPCPRTRQAGNDDVHALYDEAIRRRGWGCCLTTWWVPVGPLAVVSGAAPAGRFGAGVDRWRWLRRHRESDPAARPRTTEEEGGLKQPAGWRNVATLGIRSGRKTEQPCRERQQAKQPRPFSPASARPGE